MRLKLKFLFIVAIAVALVLAFGGDGFLYDPVEEGMPHNTTGQEWDQSPKSKGNNMTPSPQGKY